MARLIQETIRKALADELLFGKLVSGGKVVVDYQGEGEQAKVVLEYPESAAQPPATPETEESVA
jgi:ATP-dependent Clp protease ATP-binding subunit ClpA